MKTSHINHIALYAKNFYCHTGNLIADMQKYCQLDGIEFSKIDTREKLLAVMNANFKEWAESLPDDNSRFNFYKEDVDNDNVVYWERDKVKARIYSILIDYADGIPLCSKYLSCPIYDIDHRPQFNIKYPIFNKHDFDKAIMEKVQNYLDQFQYEFLDAEANKFLNIYDWKKAAKFLNLYCKDDINAKDLEDEWWDAYNSFVEEHNHEDGSVDPGYHHIETPHFSIFIKTTNDECGIESHLVIDTNEGVSTNPDSVEALKEIFEGFKQNVNEDKVDKYQMTFELDSDRYPKFLDDEDSLRSLFNETCDKYISCVKNNNLIGNHQYAMFEYSISRNAEEHLKVVQKAICLYECANKDNELYNTKNSNIDGESY